MGIEGRLVLETIVPEVEVVATLLERRAVPLIVPEFGQPFTEHPASGEPIEITVGDPILGLDPLTSIGGTRILQPPIGISDEGAMIVVDHIIRPGIEVLLTSTTGGQEDEAGGHYEPTRLRAEDCLRAELL